MEQGSSENPIDINKWTTDFCTALRNLSPDIPLFTAQCDSFIDQILNSCVLDPPNQDLTSTFLDDSIPSIINVVINFSQSISNQELMQSFVFLISNFTVLFQWIFSSDYFNLFQSFVPIFNEKSDIYTTNNGGQKPSEMWRESMKKFIDLNLFEVLTCRFLEEDIRIEHFQAYFQVFSYLVPALDIKPSIELGAQLFQYFQTFLNETDVESFDKRIDSTQILMFSMREMAEIMGIIHDRSSFLKGIESYMHLLQILVEIDKEDKLKTSFSLISFLVDFQSEEVNNNLKDFIMQSDLCQKVQEIPNNVLKLIVNDIPAKDLLKYLLSIKPIINSKDSLTLLQPEKMIELIKIIPEDDTNIPPVLVSVACLVSSSKPQLTESIITNSFQKLNLSSISSDAFSPLYNQYSSQLCDICVSYMNERKNNANLSLILNIFSEIVQKKPSILTDDILDHIYSLVVEEGNTTLFPIIEKAYVSKSKRKMSKKQVEMLLNLPNHANVWNIFDSMIKARGLDPFDFDISTSVFHNFKEDNNDESKENQESKDCLITNDDLINSSYIDFIFDYVLCKNIKSKNIPPPPNAPSSLLPQAKSSFGSSKQLPDSDGSQDGNNSKNPPPQAGSSSSQFNSNDSQSDNQKSFHQSSSKDFVNVNWIPQQFDLIKWPLVHFNNLLDLTIFNESLDSKNLSSTNSHTVAFKKLFNMLKNVSRSIIKPIIQTFIGILSEQNENSSFFVTLRFLFEWVKNIESCKCLKDYGVIQHYMTNAPFEPDFPNEVTVTYDNKAQTVRYDPQLTIGELLRTAAIKFGSTYESLVLRTSDNKMLSNQTLPNPDSEGYKMTGKLSPIYYDEIPCYILSDDEIAFNSFLLTKLLDDLPDETQKLIESFLEYLPTDIQIQELVSNPEEFVESLKTQEVCYLYFYMIKAAIHRSRSKELINLYKQSNVFEVIKHDYLKGKFDHKNDYLLLSFIHHFFNDKQIDTEMIQRLIEEVRGIKNFNGNVKRTLEVLLEYADLSKEIEEDTDKNPLADYLVENNLVEPLITTCNDNLLKMMTKFITEVVPLQCIYELFKKYSNNAKISNIFLSVFQQFLSKKDEKEKEKIVSEIIDSFVSFNDAVLNNALIALLNKDIITADYIDKMLHTSMLIQREPMRSNVINGVISFCKSQAQSKDQQQQDSYTPLNLDNEYERCIYNFLEFISKIKYIGNDLYIENPIRSNFEYVRQELFHLKPVRDCLLNPSNQDFFVGNVAAHELQYYFSQMIIGPAPQYLYVKQNHLSPYKLLVDIMIKVFPPEMRDQLFTFVPSQCIVDPSIFDQLEKATPVVIVHLTHYTPSNILMNISINDEPYNLTGIVTKQNSFNDPSIVNIINSGSNDQQDGQLPQKHVYRTFVLEGTNWFIYQDQFISRADEEMLLPIFQAEFNAVNNNSLKPYILFYTKEKEIPKFTINFNESPEIKYSMLHFQTKDELPENIINEIKMAENKLVIERFSISNSAAVLFQNFADKDLLFTYFVSIYCRANTTVFSTPFRSRLLALNGKKELPSLDLVLSLIDTICESYKQMTQLDFADTLTLILCSVINQNVTPDWNKDEESNANFDKVVKIIEKIAELFPELTFNFNWQNIITKIFHTFILSTNTFLVSNENKNESDEMSSYDICLSLNIPNILMNSIFANFSKNRSLNYINYRQANEALHCLSCFVEILGESLRQILVHISQIQASNVNKFELMMLVMKCVKYNVFTLDELKEVIIDSNQFLSGLNIVNTLMNGILKFSTDQEVAEIGDIFYNDQILIFFLQRLISSITNDNKPLIQKLIGTSSVFFLNLFIYNNNEVQNVSYTLATKLVDSDFTEDISDFVVKIADHFNSELSLSLINHIITTCLCDHQLIAQHLIKRAEQVDFVPSKENKEEDGEKNFIIDDKNVSDSTDIFGATVYENDDIDENQEGYDYANAFFKVLENLTINNFDIYIPFILTKLATVDNLRFFIKHFNKDILNQFEKNEDEIIPRISIYRQSLSNNRTSSKSNPANARLSKLQGYELVAEFINCVLGIDPQSSIIRKIIINDKRGYVPYEFVQFIPAISTATNPDEVETFLPPKILVKSLNYSLTKINEIDQSQTVNDESFAGVNYFLEILLKHHSEFDLSNCFLNIPEITKFTLKFGCTKTSDNLMELIRIICIKNSMFKELLEDEIDTQMRRNAIVPNLDVMKMEIELNLDFENVKNNVNKVVDKIVKIHNRAVQSVLTPSPSSDSLSTLKVDPSEYLFRFYLSKHFEETPVVMNIFGISLLNSKVEKEFFSSALSKLDDEKFLSFGKNYMKTSKTLSQITFDNLDMKRIWFLLNLKPDCADKIKKMIPVDRRRVISMLKLMPDGQEYAFKVFNITNEEVGITNNNDDDDGQSNSTDIKRETVSAPVLAENQNDRRPPPAQNNNNNNDNKPGSSKPYFFQRPTMPKRKPPPK